MDAKEMGKQVLVGIGISAAVGFYTWTKAVDNMDTELQLINSRIDTQDKRIDAMVLQQEQWNQRLLELTTKIITVESDIKYMVEDTREIKSDVKLLLQQGDE